MKNKILATLMTCVVVVSACGCGQDSEQPTADVTEEVSVEASPEAVAEAAAELVSEEVSSAAEATTEEGVYEKVEDRAPDIDISGCDTFTQIIDKKLSDGMGYANEDLDGTDTFLVSSGTYDNLDGNMAAIDATLFIYKDGVPVEIGKIASDGTAYPIAIKDGKLYTGTHRGCCKYAVSEGKLVLMDMAYVEYDEKGNGTYYYESDATGDSSNIDSSQAEGIMNDLFEEMTEAKVVNFQTVGGDK